MTELPWVLLSAAENRLTRYAMTPDNWIHIQVWMFKQDNEPPIKRETSFSPVEWEDIMRVLTLHKQQMDEQDASDSKGL